MNTDINFIANLLQFVDFYLNISQTSNDEIAKRLNKQEQILFEQTNEYLKKILENQEKILKLLNDGIPKRLRG